jgi:murein DD-endopeptidase MepM/ murein hydrolase activator NlpD
MKKNPRSRLYAASVAGISAVFIALALLVSGCNTKGNGKPEIVISTGTISMGGSLYNCLKMENISELEIHNVTNSLASLYNPKKSRGTDRFEIAHTTSNVFLSLKYWTDPVDYYQVEKTSTGVLRASRERVSLQEITMAVGGEVKSTLWEAMAEKGVSAETILNFADIFSWTVDFLTDTREGDSFRVVWRRFTDNKNAVLEDKILAATYSGRETGEHTAIRFNNEYYDPDGKAMRKQFLRAPLNFRRISSYFSLHRFHPILKYFRPHLGIDYSAATGTPISSVGDGKVVFCGRKGGFGKQIIVRHNASYTSYYGHMSRFKKGIRTGSVVRQGDVIGYVGSTGLATGPHLDFRITKEGKFINFLKLSFPPASAVSKEKMPEFEQLRKERMEQLNSIVETGKKG